MTGPNQGFAESVTRFKAELSAAVTRARRASAEAREQTAGFRRETAELAGKVRAGDARDGEPTDAERRSAAARWRHSQGLPVEEFPADEPPADEPAKPVRRATVDPDDDDEDFSQHTILFRG
ncbi:hypothetical protein [Actinokineospora iranica]|uniref:Uncharacterized protein n=1 Tax=Actinokineospora iranica TaxID=1271860 RepID=A0A1G6V4C3_9PSEU|nr:hypothetical protein [Actinokineospora iranica]SDD47827.1 hypothetical protein SAMN05216174_111214 [Actinokineospora iranica]